MYHSFLLINVGSNPDRPRPGRQWLRNLYRVHQRLCMAFPTTVRMKSDPKFIAPFVPEDFLDLKRERSHAKVRRTNQQSFLFRVDPLSSSSAVIVVQSAREPDWDYAFHNAGHFLAAPPCVRPAVLDFALAQRLRFRLFANPVRQVSAKSKGIDGKPLDSKWLAKDVPVANTDLERWLRRRAEPDWSATKGDVAQHPPGFRIESVTGLQAGYAFVSKGREGEDSGGKKRRTALYNGVLEVTSPTHFKATLIKGVGPAKAFGFGLLSVAQMPK